MSDDTEEMPEEDEDGRQTVYCLGHGWKCEKAMEGFGCAELRFWIIEIDYFMSWNLEVTTFRSAESNVLYDLNETID